MLRPAQLLGHMAHHPLRLRLAQQRVRALGDRQHGLPDLRVASLTGDLELVEQARVDAFEIIDADPGLAGPEHGPLLREVRRTFTEAWKWVSAG